MQLANLGIEWMIKIGICDISKVLYTIKKIWVHSDRGKKNLLRFGLICPTLSLFRLSKIFWDWVVVATCK